MSISKKMTEDIETATLRLKLMKAMSIIAEEWRQTNSTTKRKRELHVSDFTTRDKQFCARSIVKRYLEGEGDRGTTPVMFDGKFREEKWKLLLDRSGLLKTYQLALEKGRLHGHPDYVIVFNGTKRIVELTGHDSKVPEKMRWAREAQKRRQVRLYQALSGIRDAGFVIVEDKGNNDFRIEKVEWDAEKSADLVRRVLLVNAALDAIKSDPQRQSKIIRKLGRCEKKKCGVCDAFPD